MTRPASPRFERLIAALPDAVTSAVFISIWMYPFALGDSAIRNAMLIMLVEFILVHASGFLGGVVLADHVTRSKRVMTLLTFAMFYLVFIGAFMIVFREGWPLAAFGWLVLGKFAGVIGRPRSARQRARMTAGWTLGAMFYLGGVFATVFLPVPRLGIGTDAAAQLGLAGSGLWVDEPHRVIAFGAIYFALSAWSKWGDWLVGADRP